jgi:hypothetical protein
MGAASKASSATKAVREAANSSIDWVLSHYLPGGRWESSEYVALNPTRQDARPGSFKLNGCDATGGEQ